MLTAEISSMVKRVLSETGLEVIYFAVSGHRQIAVVVDRDPPLMVTASDLTAVSREIRQNLQSAGFDKRTFNIQVNSPGLDRRLTRPKDFVRFKDETIKVRLKTKVNGRRNFKGRLLGWHDNHFFINPMDGGPQVGFNLSEVAEARLVPNFKQGSISQML
jgi:ribosome maturation factor RimP